jgi:type I restriction enzyme M protein
VLPFDLVQQHLLIDELTALQSKERALTEASAEIEAIMDSLSEEEKDTLLNDANDAFVTAEITKALKQAFEEIETPEIRAINELLELLANKAKKPEQEQFVQAHPEVQWAKIEANKNGTYAVGKVKAYLKTLQANFTFAKTLWKRSCSKWKICLHRKKS